MKNCLECDKPSRNAKFCCNKCKCKRYYRNNKTRLKPLNYTRQKYRRQDRKRLLVIAAGGKCQICGYDNCVAALTFHHRDKKQKTFNISKNSRSFETLQKEAAKCDLLCIRCHLELENQLYQPRATNSTHPNRYVLNRQRALKRKQSLVALKDGQCQKCGYSKCLRALSFHHRDPTEKSFSIDLRVIGNRKWETIIAEAAKCDLYCVRCHTEIEAEIRNGLGGI